MSSKKKFGEVQSKERDTPFWRIFNNLEMGIGVVCVAVITAIAFCNVVTRYVLGFSISWAEEVCKFLIIWATFGGAAYAFRLGVNIGVSFFVDKLPHRVGFWVAVVIKLMIIAFFVMLLMVGVERVADQVAKGQISTAARIPMAIPFAAIPLGSVLVIVRLLQQIKSDIAAFRKEGGVSL